MAWSNAPVVAAVAAVLSACTVYQYPRQTAAPQAPVPAYATYYGPPGLHGAQPAYEDEHDRHAESERRDGCSCPCDCSEPGARAATPATRRAIPQDPADWLEPEDPRPATRPRAPDDFADWLEPRSSSPPRPRVIEPAAPPTPPLQRIPDDPADWLE